MSGMLLYSNSQDYSNVQLREQKVAFNVTCLHPHCSIIFLQTSTMPAAFLPFSAFLFIRLQCIKTSLSLRDGSEAVTDANNKWYVKDVSSKRYIILLHLMYGLKPPETIPSISQCICPSSDETEKLEEVSWGILTISRPPCRFL